MQRALLFAAAASIVLVAATGCFTAGAKTLDPLRMPEPPSRVVVPSPPPPAEPPPAAAPPATTPVSSPPPTAPPPPNPTPPRPTGTTPPPVTTAPPEPTPTLQTTTNTVEQVRKIQEQIDNAKRDLGKIDRAKLSRAVKDQFDRASELCRLAEDYLKVKAFDLADRCSDKAARMANELAKGFISPTSP